MNELKNVTNKLFKTELESHKVDLALTDDIDKLFKEALNFKNKYKGSSEKLIESVKDAKRDIQNYRDKLNDSGKLINDLKNKSKELGLELPKDIISKQEMIDKEIKLSIDFNSILMKMQQDIPLV
jgi:hypothetical protein